MYRKASVHDIKTVYDLICDMEQRTLPFDRFQEIYCRQLRRRDYYCLVCEQNNRVVGVLNLRFEEQLHHADSIAEIMEFVVASECRKQGIGKGMLEQACLIAREFGCAQIEVACNRLREDTHRFYLREGMQNYHYKFSKPLAEDAPVGNAIGR